MDSMFRFWRPGRNQKKPGKSVVSRRRFLELESLETRLALSTAGPSVIRTPFDTIPNFGAHPTIWSVASGNWSDTHTWSLRRLPTTGDIVDIEPGTTVTYDVMKAAALNTVEVLGGGELQWRPDFNTEIVVGNFVVLPGGDLEIGTASAPIAANVMAKIVIANQAIDTAVDPSQFGTGLIGLGTVSMAGAVKTPFVALATEPDAGDTTLALSQAPAGWRIGDELFLPDTQQYYSTTPSNMTPQWEMATIASINGATVRLTHALRFDHLGARNADGTLRFLPDVVNMTRNVMIASQSPQGTRGYVMFTGRADVDIQDVGFCELGRTTVNPLDNTTFGSFGRVTHLGANEDDRFPMYFHHLDGPALTPSDGYQFTAIGNVIDNEGSTFPLQKWGMVVEASSYGLLADNVVENVSGSGFVTQDGTETNNRFQGNFAALIAAPGPPDEGDLGGNPGRDGAAYWFRGHDDYVVDNVAADAAIGFQYMSYRLGTVSVPRFQGASSANAADMENVNMGAVPILEFQGDEAYGAMGRGLDIWEIGSYGEILYAIPTSTIKDFSAWNFFNSGITVYRTHCLTFDGIVLRGNLAEDGHTVGINLSSGYRLRDHTITNSDIQNLSIGVLVDTAMVGGMTVGSIYKKNLPQTSAGDITIASSLIVCYTGIQINSLPWDGHRSAPRHTLIENVRFGRVNYAIAGRAQQFIAMNYIATDTNVQPARDLLERDQVQVVNFNGVTGDDFALYYLQQAPHFVVPMAGLIPNLPGAPAPGLTNEETWNRYHIAIAGAMTPATAATRSHILGLVQAT